MELKELVGFEKTNRSSLKQFLKAAEKIKDTTVRLLKSKEILESVSVHLWGRSI
mgnify:CR=1 FL=1